MHDSKGTANDFEYDPARPPQRFGAAESTLAFEGHEHSSFALLQVDTKLAHACANILAKQIPMSTANENMHEWIGARSPNPTPTAMERRQRK